MNRRVELPKSVIAICLIVAALARPAFAAGLEARVDTLRPSLGESFTLTLTSEDLAVDESPDLAPLASDFDVLRTGTSSQTRIVNGDRSDTRSWVVTLAPKTTGRLTIPSIPIGGLSSEPIEIDVSEASPVVSGLSGGQGIGMELFVEEGTRHEYEEIPLTLRIVDALGMRDARLSEPNGDDFTLEHVGEDRTRLVEGQDGAPLRVTERHYVLKPRRSGTLTVPPLTLQARVSDPSARRSPFASMGMPDGFGSGFGGSLFDDSFFDDVFDRGREVVVRSEPLIVDVLARPGTGDGWFLPARNVELQDSWAERSASTLRVGEATTRTIRLVALGASSEQLPDLALGEPDGVRLYVDRTRDDSIDTPDGTAAVREIEISVVPTRAGETTLPAIEVAWWDTDADAERVTRLPARTIDVSAGSGAGNARTSAAPASVDPDSRSGTDATPAREDAAASAPVGRAAWIVALVGSFVVLGAGLWFGVRRRVRRRNDEDEAPEFDEAPAKVGEARGRRASSGVRENASRGRSAHAREVIEACRANDPRRAYRAFGDWLRAVDPGRPVSVAAVEPVSPKLADALAALESRVFADRADSRWDGEAFRRAFESERRRFGRTVADDDSTSGPLPSLYPI